MKLFFPLRYLPAYFFGGFNSLFDILRLYFVNPGPFLPTNWEKNPLNKRFNLLNQLPPPKTLGPKTEALISAKGVCPWNKKITSGLLKREIH